LHHVRDEAVRVQLLAADCDEEHALARLTRIVRHVNYNAARVARQLSARRMCDIAERYCAFFGQEKLFSVPAC
jgi:hypothetical protein